MPSWIVLIGFVVLIAGAAAAAARNAAKRREALARLAAEWGWSFVQEGGPYASALSNFPLFIKGHSRRAFNVLQGGEGDAECWAFDYRYTTGGGRSSRTHRQTLFVFPHQNANFPPFELRPEHLFHKIGAAFGYQDIDLPSHPGFSSKFLLRGQNPVAVRELFDGELVRAIEAERTRCVEGNGSALVIYRERETVNANRMLEELERAQRLREAFVQSAGRPAETLRPSAAEFLNA